MGGFGRCEKPLQIKLEDCSELAVCMFGMYVCMCDFYDLVWMLEPRRFISSSVGVALLQTSVSRTFSTECSTSHLCTTCK